MRLGQRLGILVGGTLLLAGGPALPALSAGPATGRPVVLPLGDSITYGTSWAGYVLPTPQVQTPGGYRGYLASDLAADGQSFTYTGSTDDNPPAGTDGADYRHEGHPGFRIDQIEQGLTTWSDRTPIRPSVVVLIIGSNDVAEGYDPAGHYPPGGYSEDQPAQRAEFVGHLLGRLEGLLEQIDRVYSHPRVVLGTIPPMGVTTPDPTDQDYDQAIRTQVGRWAARQGLRVVVADVGAAFMAQPTYHDLIGPDGVHPTPAGYRLMASVIAPAIATARQRWPD